MQVRFVRFYAGGIAPERASQDAQGTLPMRAVRYCEALRFASSLGFYLYPPRAVTLEWSGRAVTAAFDGEAARPIADTLSPDDDGFMHPDMGAVPLLSAMPEPGIVQVNLGFGARVPGGYGILLRAPANYPTHGDLFHYEGVVDPSNWFGPLFINVRLTRTNEPVRIFADRPFAQAQLVPLHMLTARHETVDAAPEDWEDYRRFVCEPNDRPQRAYGEYAVRARKASKCPVHADA
jgi:hypothetical protein